MVKSVYGGVELILASATDTFVQNYKNNAIDSISEILKSNTITRSRLVT